MFFSAVAGTGDTRALLYIQFWMTVCVLAYAFCAAIVFGLPLEVVWAAEIVHWLLCLALSRAWFRRAAPERIC